MSLKQPRIRKAPVLGVAALALAWGCASAGSQTSMALTRARAASSCPARHFRTSGSANSGYPAPSLSVSCDGSTVTVKTNDIPDYAFVAVTPNALRATPSTVRFPQHPRPAAHVTALPRLGMDAIAVNGLLIATPNEAQFPAAQAWGDPVFNYQLDRCMGHMGGNYHYHALIASCLAGGTGSASPILGYAFDGFPIYGPRGCLDRACRHVVTFRSSYERVPGRTPATYATAAYRYVHHSGAEYLDRCNGRIGPDGTYRYYATYTYPYVIGCYRGTLSGSFSIDGGGGPGAGGQVTPVGYGCSLTSTGKVACRQRASGPQ